jgi:hypothetical protein
VQATLINTAKTVMNTIEFTTLSKSQVVKHIWANRDANGYEGKNADVKNLTDAELEMYYNNAPLADVPQVVSTETVEDVTNVVARIATNGATYYTIGLELIETNGVTFRFKHNDKIVTVTGDLDLYAIHKKQPIAIGTIVHFNYQGADTFRNLTDKVLIANNKGAKGETLPIPERYRGTVCKSSNDIFAPLLIDKEERKMQRTIATNDVALELGISTRQVRQVMNANLATDIAERMKAKLG